MSKFFAGYADIDVSGEAPISYYMGLSTGVHDPIQIHCTAVSDGRETALLMSLDLKKMLNPVAERSLAIIEQEFHIPPSHVILSCTHTHTAPDAGAGGEGNAAWLEQYYEKLPQVVRAALEDLDPVKGAFAGVSEMEPGVTFVRRYLLPDGSYKTNAGRKDNVICHESQADPEMRTIRLERESKKPILLVNFQTHYGGATGMYPGLFSADFIAPFREAMQKEADCHFVYYSGGGGNINFNSPIPGEKKYPDFLSAIPAFASAAKRAIAAEKPISLGKIRARRRLVSAKVRHDSPERLAEALEVQKAGYNSEEGNALLAKYGFGNKFDAYFTIVRSRMPEEIDVPVNAIVFGDVAFCGAPYEMFDTSAKEIRDGSPVHSTFVCSLSGGAHCYMPSRVAYSHGAYETYNCSYVMGTAEKLVENFLDMIRQCREA